MFQIPELEVEHLPIIENERQNQNTGFNPQKWGFNGQPWG
jgi:hypothetical protein